MVAVSGSVVVDGREARGWRQVTVAAGGQLRVRKQGRTMVLMWFDKRSLIFDSKDRGDGPDT